MSNNGNSTGKIPFLDLVTLHNELEAELVPCFRTSCELPVSLAALPSRSSSEISRRFATRAIVSASAAAPTPFVLR